jgi:hypothetical protein
MGERVRGIGDGGLNILLGKMRVRLQKFAIRGAFT